MANEETANCHFVKVRVIVMVVTILVSRCGRENDLCWSAIE